MLKARYVAGARLEQLLEPGAPEWSKTTSTTIDLMGTPASMQPTDAIRQKWLDKKIGNVTKVQVQALHNGGELCFRLEWEDSSNNNSNGDNSVFPDGAAILLPCHIDSPLITMGAPGKEVNAWFWRADAPSTGRHVTAAGMGSSHTMDLELVKSNGSWDKGRWSVVIARSMKVDSKGAVAQLVAGRLERFGVAVWDGNNQERAGIKSFSPNWIGIELAAGK